MRCTYSKIVCDVPPRDVFLQASTVDEVMEIHAQFLSTCVKECLVSDLELLKVRTCTCGGAKGVLQYMACECVCPEKLFGAHAQKRRMDGSTKMVKKAQLSCEFFTLLWGTIENVAEIGSTLGYILMHAVILEMVTEHLNHSITSFIAAGGLRKNKLWPPFRLIAYI